VSFAAITLCVASQRVFIVVSVYFVIDSVRKLLVTHSYEEVAVWFHSFLNLGTWVGGRFCASTALPPRTERPLPSAAIGCGKYEDLFPALVGGRIPVGRSVCHSLD
jgi:hypothetical protein